MDHHLNLWPDLYKKPTFNSMEGKKSLINGNHHESGLFSSSLTEIFSRKCKLIHISHLDYINLLFSSIKILLLI